MEIDTIVKDLIQQYIEDSDSLENLSDEDNLKDALNIDSLDMVELIVDLESQFDIDINDEDIASITSFSDIRELILSKKESVQ